MRRRLLNLVTMLSALLGVAVGVLGVRSFWHRDGVGYASPTSCWSLWSGHGLLGTWGAWGEGLRNAPPDNGRYGWHMHRPKPYWLTYLDDSHWNPRVGNSFFGFYGWGRSTPHVKLDGRWTVEVPHWTVVVLAATLPIARLGKRCRERLAAFRKRRLGLCPRCGYDLRATIDRCPECGRPVDRREPAAA